MSKSKQGLYPDRIGPYAITGLIAEGGMSLVLAGEGEDGEAVAIKLAEVHDPRGRERFRREIEACRRLNHKGIIRIRAVGEHQGRPWYAMDHHGEVTLRELIECNGPGVANELPALIAAIQRRDIFALPPERRRLLPRSASVELAIAIGEAVAHAHERGLVHRDLKPENVLLQPSGQPVVVDFGLVADIDGGRRLTQTSKVVGTMGYLAPEQFSDHRHADERVDVYAMGVLLRELLTGVGPSDDPQTRHVTVGFHTSTRLQRDPGDRPLDRALALVLFRATHPDPRRRYRSMPAFLADLGHIQRGEPILARPDPVWLRLVARLRRWRAQVVVALIAVVVIGAGVLAVAVDWRLRELAWASWTERHQLDRAEGVSALEALAGSWRLDDRGISPIAGGALAAPAAQGSWLRLEAEFAVTGVTAGAGLFAAADRDHRGGYLLEIGGGVARLERRGRLLALAPCALGAGEHRLRWRMDADGHRIELDGDELLTAIDDAPLPGGRCGIHARDAAWRWSAFALRPAGVRGGADPTEALHRLASVADDLPPEARASLGAAADEALAVAPDRPAVLIAGADALRALGDRRAAQLLDQVAVGERDRAWHRANLLVRWGEAPASELLAPVAAVWADPATRDAVALWLLRSAQDLGDPEPLLATRRWSEVEVPSPLVAQAAAAMRYRCLRWELEPRLRDLATAAAGTAPPWAARAAARAWWVRTHGLGGLPEPATRPDAALLARLERRAAAVAGRDQGSDAVVDLVMGRDPAARFDPDLAQGAALLGATEAPLLAALAAGIDPDAGIWNLPDGDGFAAAVDARLRGEAEWSAAATAAAAEGVAPWTLPWHRLHLAALAVADDDANRRLALLALGEVELDAWAGGLCYRLLTGQGIGPDEVARCAGAVRVVVAALHAQRPPDPALRAPAWHPSRPLLDLALALHARATGDQAQAEARLRELAAHPAWPEGRAARHLLDAETGGNAAPAQP